MSEDCLFCKIAASQIPAKVVYSDEELVSADIIGTNYSAIVDAQSTMAIGDRTVKVLAWYDNEWGYARRVADLTAYIAEHQG